MAKSRQRAKVSGGTSVSDIERALPYAIALLKARENKPSDVQRFRNDPVGFINTYIDWPEGQGLTPYQEEILSALPVHRRVAAYGPHGLGKTTLESLALIWFSVTRDDAAIDWKNPTLASVWRQLTKFLWPEVHKWSRRLRWKDLGVDPWDSRTELLTISLKLKYGESFAVASDDPTSLEGAHADSLLYTFDESKAIPAGVWDSVEGAFSGSGDDTTAEAFALACSTPGEESGRFYEICSRKPGLEDWWVRHVTLEEAIAAGRVSTKWAEQRRLQWGEDSAVYRNRVLGEFAASDSTGVIPLAWVEKAIERYDEVLAGSLALDCVGVDVGGGGDGADLTTFALRSGETVTEIRRFGRGDTMETVGRINQVVSNHGGIPIVDSIGIGAGVVSRLREMDQEVIPFNAAEGTLQRDHSGELGFANMRAWSWWNLRELLDPTGHHQLALPPDDLLIGDLTAPRWRVQSGGRIIIESKDDIRKRIGRSTDTGDAVVMAMASRTALEPITAVRGEYTDDPERRRILGEDYSPGQPISSGLLDKIW